MLHILEALIGFAAFCAAAIYLHCGIGNYRDHIDDASDYLQEGWPEDIEK